MSAALASLPETATVPYVRSLPARDAFRTVAVGFDRSHEVEAPVDDAWDALLDGRLRLVDRFADRGRRYLIARPVVASADSLSHRVRRVLSFAARGYTNKQIAYVLDLAPSTVSSHLVAGMRRLGVGDRGALAELFSRGPLCAPPPDLRATRIGAADDAATVFSYAIETPDLASTTLTPSEIAVAELAIGGRSNAEIAGHRGTSIRTVANQMSSLLAKLGCGSRTELAARYLRDELVDA